MSHLESHPQYKESPNGSQFKVVHVDRTQFKVLHVDRTQFKVLHVDLYAA